MLNRLDRAAATPVDTGAARPPISKRSRSMLCVVWGDGTGRVGGDAHDSVLGTTGVPVQKAPGWRCPHLNTVCSWRRKTEANPPALLCAPARSANRRASLGTTTPRTTA